jgi:hypothetical protein
MSIKKRNKQIKSKKHATHEGKYKRATGYPANGQFPPETKELK